MQNEYDLVIIGSGAGGAPIAHELARKGKSVLMLEKGPLILPQYQATTGVSGFRRDEVFSTGAEKILRLDVANKGMPYYSSHVEPDLNDEPHIYRRADGSDDATIEGYTAQVVGGGTQLYGGVSLRFTPRDLTLAQWNNRPGAALDGDPNDEVRRAARDWPFPYATSSRTMPRPRRWSASTAWWRTKGSRSPAATSIRSRSPTIRSASTRRPAWTPWACRTTAHRSR